MEKLAFKNYSIPAKKKKTYRFQDVCLELAEASGLNKGILFGLWKKVGNEIYQIKAEHEQGEIKNLKIYILWKLKNNQNGDTRSKN